MAFIDAHSHVWTDDFASYPLAPGETTALLVPARFTPEELLALARPAGVDRVVLIQHSAHGTDNSYVIDSARRFPGVFSVVAVVDQAAPGLQEQMLRLAAAGARGFRIRPGPGPADRWLDGPGYERMFAVAAARGLAICPLLNPAELPALSGQCIRHPATTVVIDHMARVGINEPVRDEHVRLLLGMARHRRVYVKVSAFYAFGARRPPYDDVVPLVRSLLRAYGPRRLMWGTDCPYQLAEHGYRDSLELVRDRLPFLGAEERRWLLEKTARAVYFRES